MWVFFALLAPSFWAVVHVLDEHCVDHVLEKPWMGVVTSALASIVVFISLPFFIFFIDFETLNIGLVLAAFFAGVLIQSSQAFYFHALAFSEAGIVAAYWNMVPAILPIVSFAFLGEILLTTQYLGIVILIFSSTIMCILDYHMKTRHHTFLLMLGAAVFQVIAYLIMDEVYHKMDYLITFYSVIFGIIITGIMPLAVNKIRMEFIKALVKIKPAAKFFIYIEISNLFALGSAQMAIKLGDASLVAAAETTMPAFTFFTAIFWLRHSQKSQVALWNNFIPKILTVVLMVIGVWLLTI